MTNKTEYFWKDSRRWDSRWVVFGIPNRYCSATMLNTIITKEETQSLQDFLILNRIYPRRNRKFREKFLQTLASKETSIIGSQFHQDENAGMAYWSEAYCFETADDAKKFGEVLESITERVNWMKIKVYLDL